MKRIILPLIPDGSPGLARDLAAAARLKGRSVSALVEGLDRFVERTMASLGTVDRKPPMAGYSKAFESALSRSVKASGKSSRDLLRGFFFPYWRIFHLRAYPPYPHLATVEKCRTAFLPESDVGAICAANKDDPLGRYRPLPIPRGTVRFRKTIWHDGTGSGLHFDEEPAGFFPVDYGVMHHTVARTARDVPEAVEMLEGLSPNWGRANVILMDEEKRSARIDKCSFNRFAARVNTRPRIEHISGMVCFDPKYKAYQRSLREAYLESVGGTWGGYEGASWDSNELKDRVLDEGLKKIAKKPTYDGLLALLTRHEEPGCLCKHGAAVLRGEPVAREYTLERHFFLMERGEHHRWCWDRRRNRPTCEAPREIGRCEIFR